jgi:hypothetical protein
MDRVRNPYRTAPGSDPPELAGRGAELGAARYAIEMTKAGEPAKPLVFVGLRGMGKTALLRRVAADARESGGITIVGEADRSLRFGEVMRRELAEALTRSESLPSRLGSVIRRAIEKLPKISYEIPHGAGSLQITGNETPAADDLKANDSLEDLLLMLNEQLHHHGRSLTIGLDEIQESRADDLLRIIRVVHKTAGTEHPILFVGAGLPNSAPVLRSVRTYTERWAYFRLGLLTRADTFDALDVPARALGVHWDQDAIEQVYVRTLGYPYFLQEYASAAWVHHRGERIAADDVVATATGVQRMLDESVYDRSFASITPREAIYALALHGLGPGTHHSEAIAGALSMEAADLSSVRTQLIKKDVIFSPARGLTEFRMPLTNEYIDRHLPELQKRSRLGENALKPKSRDER